MFKKNEHQKKVVICSILGVIVVLGSIVIIKSYALYKEEKTFNVIRGQIPEFRKGLGDLTIAALIDGKATTKIPKKGEPYVFEGVTCNHDAIAKWNNETWSLSIENITSSGTICTLSFLGYGFDSLVATIQSSATTIDELLSSSEDIDKIVNSEDAMAILVKEEKLREAIKSSDKYTIEVAKKFLNSTVISESEKYDVGLPCYLFKDGKDLVGGFTMQRTTDDATGAFPNGSSYNMNVSYAGNSVAIISNNKIDTSHYQYLEMYSSHYNNHNKYTLTGTTTLGISADQSIDNFLVSNSETYGSASTSSTLRTNINSYNSNSYLKIRVKHNGSNSTTVMFTVSVGINTIAVY